MSVKKKGGNKPAIQVDDGDDASPYAFYTEAGFHGEIVLHGWWRLR